MKATSVQSDASPLHRSSTQVSVYVRYDFMYKFVAIFETDELGITVLW